MSRLPSLGSRGQGWLAIQTLLMGSIPVACFATARGWLPLRIPAQPVIGLVLFAIGLAIAIVGRIQLGTGFAFVPMPPAQGDLVQNGLYGVVRNPIYDAVVLLGVGGSLVVGALVGILLSVLLAGFLVVKAHREEAWLRQRYPGYDEYARRVKRFVPFIY